MPYTTDIIVLSNVAKDVGPDVTVMVGLPNKNPWSLPFGHKRSSPIAWRTTIFLFTAKMTCLLPHGTSRPFCASDVLPEDEIPGYLRFEEAPDGALSYPDVHFGYHWDVNERNREGFTPARSSPMNMLLPMSSPGENCGRAIDRQVSWSGRTR